MQSQAVSLSGIMLCQVKSSYVMLCLSVQLLIRPAASLCVYLYIHLINPSIHLSFYRSIYQHVID